MGLLKKSGDKLKETGHKVEAKAEVVGHKAVDVGKDVGHKGVEVGKDVGHKGLVAGKGVGHKAFDGLKKVGHKTADVAGKAAGHVDITCDKCGTLMKPGGEYTRVVLGKEYQFCSTECGIHFHPPMKKL